MNKSFTFALPLLACSALAQSAHAHRSSDSYVQLRMTDESAVLDGQWDIALRDLDYALELDDGDGALTWGELRQKEDAVRAFASAALQFDDGDAPCAVDLGPVGVQALSDGNYARFPLTVRCTRADGQLRVHYALMHGLDPQHRGIVRLEHEGVSEDAILGDGLPDASLALAGGDAPPRRDTFIDRIGEGFSHILSGTDHVLFLIALLLGTVLVRHTLSDKPTGTRAILFDLTKIVTAFTLAHSITLALAALGLVTVSAQIIEPAIAASVALAALANLVPMFGKDVWVVPFALGLLHGFGFSSGLSDAGLTRGDLWTALLGFNVGVELGQLAVVALFVPIALALRSRALPRKLVLVGGSLATLALSVAWFVERLEIG